jgi:hypothetical protein
VDLDAKAAAREAEGVVLRLFGIPFCTPRLPIG